MGCGGALEFVGGAAKRAPVFMRKAGLEWLVAPHYRTQTHQKDLECRNRFPLTLPMPVFGKN